MGADTTPDSRIEALDRRVMVLSMWLVFALSMAVFFAGVAWILRGAP